MADEKAEKPVGDEHEDELKAEREAHEDGFDEDRIEADDDWKVKARKHERAAKTAARRAEKAEADLKKRQEADKSEQDKAIDKAREEARNEALSKADQDRRRDRLEAKCAVIAAKGIQVREGDDAKTLRFADPDDALVYIERAVRNGDLADDDIFDDEGKVKTDALRDELGSLLRNKPHLAGESNGSKVTGDADGGKGSPDEGYESMSPEDHAQRKYGSKK